MKMTGRRAQLGHRGCNALAEESKSRSMSCGPIGCRWENGWIAGKRSRREVVRKVLEEGWKRGWMDGHHHGAKLGGKVRVTFERLQIRAEISGKRVVSKILHEAE